MQSDSAIPSGRIKRCCRKRKISKSPTFYPWVLIVDYRFLVESVISKLWTNSNVSSFVIGLILIIQNVFKVSTS